MANFLKFWMPYILVLRWNERATGVCEDFPLLHYHGLGKRFRRLVKFLLPYGLVKAYRRTSFHQRREMRRSALGRALKKPVFDPSAAEFEQTRGGCVRDGRTAVFACFFADGHIPDTTLHYLKGLGEVVDNILVVGDCPILPGEAERLPARVRYCRFCHHGEYDFGSYRRGWEYVCADPVLASSRELLLCNDSCYGPIGSFRETFARMDADPCDFWGMCENAFLTPHVQSYFVLLRRQAWTSPAFGDFLRSVCRQSCVMDVIVKYEIGLSAALRAAGFVGKACYRLDPHSTAVDLHPTEHPVGLMRIGCPLVKVKAVRDAECNLDGIDGTLSAIRESDPELHEMICRTLANKARGVTS